MEHEIKTTLKSPIVTVCGHVDHGKTTILDSLRGTSIAETEAGRITQKISFSLITKEIIQERIGGLLKKYNIHLSIPGFLFIDTPGHAAFTNLRKRGGSLADLAVLVIDINEGIKPQTAEVIQILKHNKTPFVIAMNKIDNISGWKTPKTSENTGQTTDLITNIESQPFHVKQAFDEKYMTLIASLNSYGFDADLFYKISDFTKKIALVPTSAITKEGIPELLTMLCGLSQKYLKENLVLGKEAKGVVLEVKKEKAASYVEAILYDGILSRTDSIAVSDFEGNPIITKIRILEEIEPLSTKFKPKDSVKASTGIRMQLVEKTEILPGMPFVVYSGNAEQIKEIFKKEMAGSVYSMLSKKGIIAKADSLGSLEALLVLLKENGISVVKAGIGNINKTDIISAKANLEINEIDAIVAGFNVSVDEEAKSLAQDEKIKILTNDVIYKLIEDIVDFRIEKKKEIEKKRLMELSALCKLRVLHQYVFRNTKPAIFGVRVEAGKLVPNMEVIDENNEKIGRIKNIQSENKSVQEAVEGMEVAISLQGANYERQIKNKEFLYSELTESGFKKFKKNKDLLSSKEISLLQEIANIKQKEKADWGM